MTTSRACLGVLLVLSGCSPSRAGAAEKDLESAARYDLTIADHDLRLALCGWFPAFEGFEVTDVRSTFAGDDKAGTGESSAAFVAHGSGTTPGFRCEGRFTFTYQLYPSHNQAAQYLLGGIRRVGAPPPVLAAVEEHATPLALDSPSVAFRGGWTLPDGQAATAYRMEIPIAGRYRVDFDKKFTLREGPIVVPYQGGAAVREGTPSGRLGFWELTAGPVSFLLAYRAADPVGVRVTIETK